MKIQIQTSYIDMMVHWSKAPNFKKTGNKTVAKIIAGCFVKSYSGIQFANKDFIQQKSYWIL